MAPSCWNLQVADCNLFFSKKLHSQPRKLDRVENCTVFFGKHAFKKTEGVLFLVLLIAGTHRASLVNHGSYKTPLEWADHGGDTSYRLLCRLATTT